MASRAHVADHYSFAHTHSQFRRGERDPVTLPRISVLRSGGGAVLAAVMLGGIMTAVSYGAYHAELAPLTETPSLALTSNWQPDTATAEQARVINLLQGPALAVPDRVMFQSDAVNLIDTAPESSTSHEVVIDDSAPGVQEHLPGAAPESPAWPKSPASPELPASPAAPPAPYPNPTSTPPDAIAPGGVTPDRPTPVLDPENPYRD